MITILGKILSEAGPWLLSHGVRIVVILAVAYLAFRFAGVFIEKIVRKAIVSNHFLSLEAEKKREDTIIAVSNGLVKVVVWVFVIFTIVSELGVNIGPLLAGAGIFGLAIGFGAQSLVKDFVSGLFILLENQYRVGDVVRVGDICGAVENINLRMTVLRDADGTVHHVPNGEIKIASNLSKIFARINLKIGVAYDTDLEKLIDVVNRVGREMAEDAEWKDSINEAPQFVRIDEFADSAMVIKITGEVKPLKQWGVLGELRKRIKIAFDKEGIEIPFPQVVVRKGE
ncbi:MAG: mechanosensitive ion channel family protein [Patescibacteria group bacterium]|nr:mechanosensitive ion channel family protein [Patescibacteria group bacterium]